MEEANGKSLKSIQIFQAEEALNLDLNLQDETVLELMLRVGFQASATLLESRNGDLIVLEKIDPKHVTTAT